MTTKYTPATPLPWHVNPAGELVPGPHPAVKP